MDAEAVVKAEQAEPAPKVSLDEMFLDETMYSEHGSDLDEMLNESTLTACTASSYIQQEGDETWPDPAFGPNQIDVSLKLLNDLNACFVSEDNQNEMELQSMKKTDTRYKCSGQSQPPPSYQNQMHSECGIVGPDLEVGQTEVNLLIYQEPEVEGTSGADADIIKNTKEQGEDTKEDKIQPNLEPQAQSEYQSSSQSQVEADDEDNRDYQALALLFADIVKIPCKEKSQRQDKLQI